MAAAVAIAVKLNYERTNCSRHRRVVASPTQDALSPRWTTVAQHCEEHGDGYGFASREAGRQAASRTFAERGGVTLQRD